PAQVVAVISNEADAYGLERVRKAGIPAEVLDHRDYADRAQYDAALIALIDRFTPGLVVLAGFMRILTADFVEHYAGRIMNIHPSLLPKFRGLDTHARVVKAGDEEHGVTVHFVTSDLDDGPIIIQAVCRVQPDDTPDSLQQRVHQLEYRVYPQAIKWFAENRLTIEDGKVLLDGARNDERQRQNQ
ncbi:MAG: phosphoribosylglycinamide formyltransferase, partial [Pseudomonadota bacterium]|nr:phosphoribosylglycinamide formyltransferase [Pseudomonadota bacterium]